MSLAEKICLSAAFLFFMTGLLQETGNQLRRPHRLGKHTLPAWITGLFMVLLIVAEVRWHPRAGHEGAMLRIW